MNNQDIMQTRMTHPPKQKPIRNRSASFSKQEVHLSDTPLFFPVGFEKLFMLLYFIFIPYIVGLLFQFFYVCGMKMEVFLAVLEKTAFMLIWAIGYEILAFLLLSYIAKLAIGFSISNSNKNK